MMGATKRCRQKGMGLRSRAMAPRDGRPPSSDFSGRHRSTDQVFLGTSSRREAFILITYAQGPWASSENLLCLSNRSPRTLQELTALYLPRAPSVEGLPAIKRAHLSTTRKV